MEGKKSAMTEHFCNEFRVITPMFITQVPWQVAITELGR